jgi:type I restriction enzyme S subunit
MSSVVPAGWSEVHLGGLIDKLIDFRGRTPKKLGLDWGGGNIKALSANNVKMGRVDFDKECYLASDELYAKWMTKGDARKDDVLFTMEAPLGNVCLVPDDHRYILSQRVILFRTNELVEPPYIYQVLAGQHFQKILQKHSTGTTATGIQQKNIVKLKLLIPNSIKEQKKIACILTSVDEVIENTQKQIDKLQDLKKATMNELLTKGIGHTEFKDSELGSIPKSWEVLTFSECDIKVLDGDRGNEYPKEADFKSSGFCLFLSAKNVTKNGFRFDTTAFITKDKDERLRKGRLNPQDIVITTRGTVGNIAFYDDSINFDTVRINSGMAIIRNNNAHIECAFIYKLLSSGVIITQLKNLTFGSAQPQLTIGTLNELQLPIPPLAEQSQIVSAISSIQIALDKMENKLAQTQSLKKSLMQDLLAGKVRVKVN